MADKEADQEKEDIGTRVVYGAATMAAAYMARKLLIAAWTKATGKKPPTNPEDPRVALAEALTWSVLVGVTVASGQGHRHPGGGPEGDPGQRGRRGRRRREELGRALPADKLAIAVFGKLTAVVHEEAPGTGELVSLTRDHPERELLVRQIGPGQLQGLGNVVRVKIDRAR